MGAVLFLAGMVAGGFVVWLIFDAGRPRVRCARWGHRWLMDGHSMQRVAVPDICYRCGERRSIPPRGIDR